MDVKESKCGDSFLKLSKESRDETLKIYNASEYLVPYLIGQQYACDLFSNLDDKDFIAGGSQGSVWKLDLKILPKGKYVVKKMLIKLESGISTKRISVKDLVKEYPYNIFAGLNIQLNGGEEKIIKPGEYIIFISEENICLTREGFTISRHDWNGETIIPAGSYVCKTNTFSEYMISLIVSNFFEKGISANFLSTLSFFTCFKPKYELHSHTIMQKIDGHIKEIGTIDESEMFALYIQIIHAICVYQTQFIMHLDLHLKNIFYEIIKPDTTFRGVSLFDAKYFEYKVGGTSLFIPNTGKLIKIGDWGFACKYIPPMIFNQFVLEYENVPNPWQAIEMLERWRDSRRPMRLAITGTPINIAVTLRNFDYDAERAGHKRDIYFNISFKELVFIQVSTVVQGVNAQVKSSSERPNTKEKPKTYTVVSGDSLWKIAAKPALLGNGNRWREIYELNKSVIGKNPNLIRPGQVLRLQS